MSKYKRERERERIRCVYIKYNVVSMLMLIY